MTARQPWYHGDAVLAAAVRAQRERETPPTSSSPAPIEGHTYLVGAAGQALVKIGRTTASPRTRMANLQTGSPVTLHLLATLPHPHWETVLHQHYAHLRRNGEWFALDLDQLATVLRWACESAFPDVDRDVWRSSWPTDEQAAAAGWDPTAASIAAVFVTEP